MKVKTLKYIHKLLKNELERARAGLEEAKEFEQKVLKNPDDPGNRTEDARVLMRRRTKKYEKVKGFLRDFESTDWR